MENLDLNLLIALDALLDTGSVTLAAERLHSSPPAVSRSLGRLRRALGDPLLVRAGRNLVLTPRAVELRGEVAGLLQHARALLTPHGGPDPAALERVFAIQAADAVLAGIVGPLLATVRAEAPGIVLRFLPDSLEGTPALRDGRVDLEIGVIDHADPETIVEPLAEVAMLGIAAAGHPFTTGPVTPEMYAAAEHLSVSRRGRLRGPIDERLAGLGLSRRVVATVPNYAEAMIAVRDSELVCHTPGFPDTSISAGTATFRIPLDLPSAEIAMAWHPRHHADSAHSWLRARVRATVGAALTG